MKPKQTQNARIRTRGEDRPVVLVVEDDPSCRSIYLALADSLSCETHVAPNGAAALELFRSLKVVDLILLDLDMPVMNGVAFYNRYKNEKKSGDVKIVLTSSHPFAKDISEALNFYAHAPKSTPLEELRAIFTRALTRIS